MKKYILCCLLFLLTGCSAGADRMERAEAGVIGRETAVTREMAAKTIALAFYTREELEDVKAEMNFSDVTQEMWSYPYIGGCVEQGFFAGSEEGTFRPQDAMTLWEAQVLMDRLAPDYESRIVLTEENKNMAVSYELWVQLLETALKARRGEDSLYSYGLQKREAVVLSPEGLLDTGKITAEGLDLTPYRYSRITFLEKEGEMAALLTVEAASPLVQNIYCRKEKGKLLLETGEGEVTFSYNGKFEEGICDVKLEKGKVTEVTPVASLGRCTVKRVDENGIYLAEKGGLQWAENTRIYHMGDDITSGKYGELICGTDSAEYFEKDGKICGAVIKEEAILENMRVFLKGEAQERVTLSAEGGFTLKNGKAEKKFSEKAILTADLPWFDYGILTATAESTIQITFTDGTSYAYEGILEMERKEDGFVIINELPLERYLLGVVPNEMPTSFGQTALEAQAIAARSYAYNQFYGNAYCGYGAHVTDTTSSQVYLGYNENKTAEAAIKATEGMCAVTDEGTVAQAYFYSASCGFGAGSEEVWSADASFSGTGKDYLQSLTYGNFERPKTEAEWLSFWQDWEKEGYDSDAPWYRWKVYFSRRQVTEILESKLKEISRKKRQVVLLQHKNSDFVPFSAQDNVSLGLLQGMEVSRRGDGGVAMELLLTFEKGAVKVRTEYAIRQILSPKRLTIGEPIYLQRKDRTSIVDNIMLPSGFFAVKEMKNENGELTGIALYGGGNGHGVGMSQYGAKKLAEEGKTSAEIISFYFPGTKAEKVL